MRIGDVRFGLVERRDSEQSRYPGRDAHFILPGRSGLSMPAKK